MSSVNTKPGTGVTTAHIVEQVALTAISIGSIQPYRGDFEEWKTTFSFHYEKLTDLLPLNVSSFFPLRDDVLKLVIKKMYGVIPFSREYIFKNYQRKYKDKHFLVYPAENASRLCILFSGYIDRITYNRYSWYFDESEKWAGDTAYLFLNDPGLHWYVGKEGSDDVATYSSIIDSVISEIGIDRNRVFAIGASMGGYASLLYGLSLRLGGCISVHPQLSYKGTRRYELGNWERQIRACGSNFYDVDDLVAKAEFIPQIYIESGDHPADIYALDKVIRALSDRNASFTVHRPVTSEHNTVSPSKDRIKALLNFFEAFAQS